VSAGRNKDAASTRAALWLREHGGSIRAAAGKFGVSPQAVSQAWIRQYGTGTTPIIKARGAQAQRIADLILSGMTVLQVSFALRIPRSSVTNVCEERDLSPRPESEVRNELYDEACAEVASGRCGVDVCAEYEISRGTLSRKLSDRGITLKRGGMRDRMDGRTQRAVARVRRGESVTDACAAERCAPTGVYAVLNGRRRKKGA
jgi:transposase-like protein